jgi:hypothetical protein
VNSILLVFLDLIHENVWVSRDGLNANLALTDLTKLDFGLISSLDLDTRSVNMRNVTPEDLWLRVDPL